MDSELYGKFIGISTFFNPGRHPNKVDNFRKFHSSVAAQVSDAARPNDTSQSNRSSAAAHGLQPRPARRERPLRSRVMREHAEVERALHGLRRALRDGVTEVL